MSSRQSTGESAPVTRGTLERLEPVLSGLLVALLVTLMLGAALAMGDTEQALVARANPTAAPTLGPTATLIAAAPALPASPTALPSTAPSPLPPAPSDTAEPTGASTPRPSPSQAGACVPPANWQLYSVRSGDSLQTLAWRYWTSDYSILQANCLISRTLRAGQHLYVPDVAPRQACGRPPGWVAYTVRRGDTLSSLSRSLGVSIGALKTANCLVGDTIYAGATLWVPWLPATRPAATATRTPRPTGSPTATPENTLPPGSATPAETETTAPPGSVTPEGTETTTPSETPPTGEPPETAVPGDTPPPTATMAETKVPAEPTDTPPPPDTPEPPPADTPEPPAPEPTEPPPADTTEPPAPEPTEPPATEPAGE